MARVKGRCRPAGNASGHPGEARRPDREGPATFVTAICTDDRGVFNPTAGRGAGPGTPPPASKRLPIAGELGAMPAWLVPGGERTWAIVVHGIKSTPQTGLRVMPAPPPGRAADPPLASREDPTPRPDRRAPTRWRPTEWRDYGADARRRPYTADRLPPPPARCTACLSRLHRSAPRLAPKSPALILAALALTGNRVLLQHDRWLSPLPLQSDGMGARRPLDAGDRPDAVPSPAALPAAVRRFRAAPNTTSSRSPPATLSPPSCDSVITPRPRGRPQRRVERRPAPLRTAARRVPAADRLGDRRAAGPPRAARPRSGRQARAASPRRRGGR